MNKGILLGAAAGVLALLGLKKKKSVSGVGALDFPVLAEYGEGEYGEQAKEFAEKYGVKLYALKQRLDKYFPGDVRPRWIWTMELSRGRKRYVFDFGAALVDNAYDVPTYYDIFSCLTKYNPYTFEDFCIDYDYNQYDENGKKNKWAAKVYSSVKKEYENVERLFGDVIEELQEINGVQD